MTKLPIYKLSADTPGCHQILHFNNAGAALSPTPVIDTMKNHLTLESMIGGYEAANVTHELTEKFREKLMFLFGV